MTKNAKVELTPGADATVAPRVTMADIEAEIVAEAYHVFEGTQLTVCALTLQNGFVVTGESACASAELFDEAVGRDIAKAKAIEKIWALLGFRLRDQLSQTET